MTDQRPDPDGAPSDVRHPAERTIQLRDQELPSGIRSALWARIADDGTLHLDAQDLGLPPGLMSDDGEYEYFRVIAPEDIPALVALLHGRPEDDVLALLARHWSGDRSFDLERLLRDAPFPVQFYTYS